MRLRTFSLLATASALLFPAMAHAQTPPDEAAVQGEAEAAAIVVTGSRVIANGNNAPTPVTVVTSQQLAATTPTNIPDALNKLPVFGGSRSQQTLGNAGSNAVGNFLNLRNFGVVRNLILFDGHRVPATASDGTVDVNTLPQQLVQRVDVVTGGASAVYGSDAVTGVVNFILDKNFNGLRAFGQAGISGHGDNMTWRGGIVAGTDLFGGRGHIEASYEHFTSDGIDDKFDREAGRELYTVQGTGTTASPFVVVRNSRQNNISFNGVILPGPLPSPNPYAGMQIINGVFAPFQHGTPTSTSTIESGGDGGYTARSSLLASLETDQLFGRFDYDLTDGINFYVQAGYSQSRNFNNFASFSFQQGAFPASNAYLAPATRGQLFGAGVFAFNFNRLIPTEEPFGIRARTENINVTTGLTGDSGGLKWDLYYTHGQTKQQVTNIGNVNIQRTIAASDSVQTSSGIVCAAAIARPDLYSNCVPINAFGSYADAAPGARYIRQDTHFDLTNKMDDVGASIAGSPFATWAGDVQVAVSAEYRSFSLRNVSDAQPSTLVNCTGLGPGCVPFLPVFALNTTANAYGKQEVKEGAIEINLPLLKDSTLARELNFNGAIRYTNYSTSGGVTTWKLGLDWHVTDDLRFRGTRSRDIRAPTISEFFAPRQSGITGFFDIHTNTGGLTQQVTQGNPNLVPEEADTVTLGAVYRPQWLPGFSASIDYYKIDIANAISVIGGGTQTQARCEASGGASPLCALFIRPLPFSNRTPANFPTAVESQILNVAKARTYGVDADVGYSFAAGGDGRVNLRMLVSYQPVLEETQFADVAPINRAGQAIGIPKWKTSLFAGYESKSWGINIQERFRSSLRQDPDPTLVYNLPKVAAVAYTDVTVTFRPAKAFEWFVSVNNLLDQNPPIYAGANGASPNFSYPAYIGDDLVGRYFTSGVRLRF